MMGLKKTYESTKTVHLDEHLHRQCKKIAKSEKTSVQQVINKGIREYVNRKLLEMTDL